MDELKGIARNLYQIAALTREFSKIDSFWLFRQFFFNFPVSVKRAKEDLTLRFQFLTSRGSDIQFHRYKFPDICFNSSNLLQKRVKRAISATRNRSI